MYYIKTRLGYMNINSFHALIMIIIYMVSMSVTASDDGLKLAEQVYDRPAGDDSSIRAIMTLIGDNKSTRIRELSMYNLRKKNKERWSLIRFSLPADIKDTGLLTLNHSGDNSDQWIYLPALDRTRIIASDRKGGHFVGSDFTYEDLRARDPILDEHTIQGVTNIDGVECTQLVSIPIESDSSIYTKRISCIHIPTLTPIRVEVFNSSDSKPVKRLTVEKLKKVQGYWTVLASTMYDLQADTKTQIDISKIKYNIGIPDDLFSKRGLSDSQREKPYEQ